MYIITFNLTQNKNMQLNHNIDLTNQSQGNSEKIGTKIV